VEIGVSCRVLRFEETRQSWARSIWGTGAAPGINAVAAWLVRIIARSAVSICVDDAAPTAGRNTTTATMSRHAGRTWLATR
jgi:hypothetical protein